MCACDARDWFIHLIHYTAYRIMCVCPEKLCVFGMCSDNVMHCLSVCFGFVIERPSVVHWGGLVKG